MTSIKDQFTSKKLNNFFEKDTHVEVEHLEIANVHVLSGETAETDIVVVGYASSPNLSFYDSNGKLIDVDHYLPDHYKEQDTQGVKEIIKNLRIDKSNTLKLRRSFAKFHKSQF